MELTSLQRKILREIYVLKGRDRHIVVARSRESTPVVRIGDKRLTSDQALDAVSDLYSRGLVQQRRLNRFALSKAGRQLAKLVNDSRN